MLAGKITLPPSQCLQRMQGGSCLRSLIFLFTDCACRYKREAYRGSEFAPRILAEHGIKVVMKVRSYLFSQNKAKSQFLRVTTPFWTLDTCCSKHSRLICMGFQRTLLWRQLPGELVHVV
jgi:hypothetical protein